MEMSLTKEKLLSYLCFQLNNFIPDGSLVMPSHLEKLIDLILFRVENCFSKINNKYFRNRGGVIFNHLNSDQYAMFLYFVANTLFRENNQIEIASKVFLLNKYLHSIDVFYEVELPDIFVFVHPLGTVLGRANYSNYFVVYQKCNVGSNHDIYPSMGENLIMHPGATVLGNCKIENNCRLATDALLIDMDLEDNSIYIGNPSNYLIKKDDSLSSIWL